MDINYQPKPLIAVEFPGTVVNIDKMEKTFGGVQAMSETFDNTSKRLELKFRPDDPYCKVAHGDRFNTTNIMIKVVRRTRKDKSKSSKTDFKVEVLGAMSTTYKFKAMADFQILPVTFDPSRGARSLIPDVLPSSLHSASWLNEKVPLFIPPLVYSRFDFPQNGYSDIQAKTHRKPLPPNQLPPNLIGRDRKKRGGHAVFTAFETPEVPDKPNEMALSQFPAFPQHRELKESLDELFEKRPIWSRTALIAELDCDRPRLKQVLPCCGYYFTNGPWRTLWTKFGFDPRKVPSSKIYQTLDLRLGSNIPIVNEDKVKRRACYNILPNKTFQVSRTPTINAVDLVSVNNTNDDVKDLVKDKQLIHEYFPGQLPGKSQNIFQLCDIHMEEIQELIHRNDGREEFCHEKDGWLELGVVEKIREILMADVQKTVDGMKIENEDP